jgi:hypothetical protein
MVHLWGFGVVYGRDGLGAAYFDRNELLAPIARDPQAGATVFEPVGLAAFAPPASACEAWRQRELFARLCVWISRYEAWVIARLGAAYRQQVVAAWRHQALAGAGMSRAWMQLALSARAVERPRDQG